MHRGRGQREMHPPRGRGFVAGHRYQLCLSYKFTGALDPKEGTADLFEPVAFFGDRVSWNPSDQDNIYTLDATPERALLTLHRRQGMSIRVSPRSEMQWFDNIVPPGMAGLCISCDSESLRASVLSPLEDVGSVNRAISLMRADAENIFSEMRTETRTEVNSTGLFLHKNLLPELMECSFLVSTGDCCAMWPSFGAGLLGGLHWKAYDRLVARTLMEGGPDSLDLVREADAWPGAPSFVGRTTYGATTYPDGVSLEPETLASLISALQSVFPEVYVFSSTGSFSLVDIASVTFDDVEKVPELPLLVGGGRVRDIR